MESVGRSVGQTKNRLVSVLLEGCNIWLGKG